MPPKKESDFQIAIRLLKNIEMNELANARVAQMGVDGTLKANRKKAYKKPPSIRPPSTVPSSNATVRKDGSSTEYSASTKSSSIKTIRGGKKKK